MNHEKAYVNYFKDIYEESQMKVNEIMKDHIYFKVGGPADLFLKPENAEQLKKTVTICKENSIPFYILGNASNVLIKDGGFRGVIIKLTDFKNIEVDGKTIKAEAGALLKDVSAAATKASLAGFQFACGIPGSVGGAVYMNAGAYNGEISQVIESAEVIDNEGNIITLSKDELDLGYRHSVMMDKGYVIVSAAFVLEEGDQKAIQDRVDDLTQKRESKQPLEYPSAGSTFKRPEGYFAGKLIQDAGLKGYTVGGACVSEKHAGFVINKNNGTAKDVLDVIKHVQEEVKKQFGVELHPEVRIIGED